MKGMLSQTIQEFIFLGLFVFGIPDQTYARKKEKSSQNSIYKNLLDAPGTLPSIHKIDSSQDKACNTHNGQNYAQYSFFHI
jgi:hypothetical protein